MTTERVFHHQLLVPWLTAPTSQGGLGWETPTSGNSVNNAIDPNSGLLWSDALDFLRHGSDDNVEAWNNLVEYHRKNGGTQGALARAEQTLKDALFGRLRETNTVLEVLRSGLTVVGDTTLKFSLWNRKPSAGDTTAKLDLQEYGRNTRRTSSEIKVMDEPMEKASPLGGRSGKKGAQLSVRLDQGFHTNGIPYGYMELKAPGAGQGARAQGRRQMAEDFVAAAIPALIRVYGRHERSERVSWPGLRAGKKRIHDRWKREALAELPLWFGKVAWRAAVDTGEVWLAGSCWDWLCEVDSVLLNQATALHRKTEFSWEREYQDLIKRLVASFAKIPDVILENETLNQSAWAQVQAHLEAMLGTYGLDQEIHLYGHPVQKKDSSVVEMFDLMSPRAPQRAAAGQILARVESMYAHENDPRWLETDLRSRLNASMPGLSREEVDARVADRLYFRNGQENYSLLIQGAAGLGKTNIAVWISLALHDMLEPDVHGNPTSQEMFDYIIVLTDRLDLRKNISDEAELSNGSKGTVSEIKTAKELSDLLSGDKTKVKGTGRIVVVNLHKFPTLLDKIKKQEVKIKRDGGRIAFLIDEVHRSNQGKLNSKTQDTFLEDVAELSAGSGTANKKNLIVGLTASPTDAILARFGRWQPGTGVGNPGCWTPHFAYGMSQAIEDGYVLDPLRGLVRLETTLDIDADGTLSTANKSRKDVAKTVDLLEVYENPVWQKKTAEQFAKIFLTTTMQSCRDNHNTNLVGRGKAMVTMPSVKAAIGMQKAIQEALKSCAEQARGTPWERYAHLAEAVAKERVFILYSDPGKRAGAAMREDTGINSGCERLNPKVEGALPTEDNIIDMFKCKDAKKDGNARNAIIVVVDKLLTGFDEPTLHTLMIARNLSGVNLLQTMCRVNRTRPGKNDCLVIDASYDHDGVGLGPEAARVFHRYGGLTTSRLDGLALMERVQEQRKDIMKVTKIKAGWAIWAKKKTDDAQRSALLASVTRDLVQDGSGTAVRRMIGSYLSQQRLADPIMKLSQDDRNEAFLEYLLRLHNSLGTQAGDDKIPVQFTVADVDAVAQEAELDPIKTRKERELETAEDQLVDDLRTDGSFGDSIDHLLDLQELQEEKAKRVARLRQFLADLNHGINMLAEKDPASAQECRNLKSNQLGPVEAAETFNRLVSRVKLSKVPGGKGRGRWLDQVEGRRELAEWLREPVRMDLAMTGWMTQASN